MLQRVYWSKLSKISGWFSWVDYELFAFILDWQEKTKVSGDLLEIGCYMGKSAILMGYYTSDDEIMTVIDLFEGTTSATLNKREMNYSYSTLTQKAFESNYLTFHQSLPKILPLLSSKGVRKIKRSSCRFMHIDGSHSYDQVAKDIAASKVLATQNGIVICDDYRSEHTPGVAAATWEAVHNGLKPVCISHGKLYGTWGDPKPLLTAMKKWITKHETLSYVDEKVYDYPLIRVVNHPKPQKPAIPATKELENTAPHRSKIRRATTKAHRLYNKIKG